MSYESPNLNLYSSDGYEATVQNNVATPVGTRGLISAGSDGTTTRFNLSDSSGRQIVAGAGTAGTPAAGVLSIQGVVGGTVLPISGTVASTQSGAWTVQPGNTANTTPWLTTINQGGNSATVKAASVAAVSTDPALVVAISPNNSFTTVSSDISATGALGALNAAVTITIPGKSTVGFQLSVGTLIGTIVAEMSLDNGTTWNSTYFDQVTGSKTSSVTFSTANTALASNIVGVGGAGMARVRVSAYTSGTANITLRASNVSDPSTLTGGVGGSTLPPLMSQMGGSVTTAVPTYTTGTLNALSLTTSGALRTDSSFTTQPVSGTVTSNQGTPSPLLNAWSTKITDGANGPVAVKAPSTAALATDPSLVVGLSPNSPLPIGTNLIGKFAITSPAANAAGINATVSTTGALLTANQFGNYLFTDDFNGSSFDPNLWTLTTATGGTGTAASSVATISTTTTVGSSSILNGVPIINRIGGSFLAMGVFAKFEATTILTGVTRFFGLGTTTSGSITDAIGFELNTSGVMTAVIYAGGTKIYNQTVTTPLDGNYHTYTFSFRPGTALFYIDAFEVPVASSTLSPNVTNLPTLVFNKVITAPSSAASIILQSMAIVDAAEQNTGISDGVYGFRKATVKAASTAALATDSPLVVGLHPSSPLPAGTNLIGSVNLNNLSFPFFVTGNLAAGATTAGNPLIMGGSDGINVRYLHTDTSGNLYSSPTPDLSVTGTITVVSTFGQIATGLFSSASPTAGSFVSITLSGQSSVEASVPAGTFSGTGLTTEATVDGTNWFTVFGTVPGFPNFSSIFTVNTHIRYNSSTWTQFRVRAVTGTTLTTNPTIHIAASYSDPGAISDFIANRLTDGVNNFTIKPASTASVATDTSIVVALNPSTPLPPGGNTIGFVSENYFGESSSYPDPSSYNSSITQPSIDAFGNIQIRGTVLTDELTFRDDFTGASLTTALLGSLTFTNGSVNVTGSGTAFTSQVVVGQYIKKTADAETFYVQVSSITSDTSLTLVSNYTGTTGSSTSVVSNWQTLTPSGGSFTVASSTISASCGTTANAIGSIKSLGDYLPFSVSYYMSISQRIINQTIYAGFQDVVGAVTQQATVQFTGTINTQVNFVTSFANTAADTQTTTVTLPNGGNTSTFHIYKIDLSANQATLSIDGIVVAINSLHLPKPYTPLYICSGVINGATPPASSTNFVIDLIFFENTDRLQIDNDFGGEPLYIQGAAAGGQPYQGNPVLVAGYDGANAQTLRTTSISGVNALTTASFITDGTNGPATVKAASAVSVATDKALVVQLSTNSPNSVQDRTAMTVGSQFGLPVMGQSSGVGRILTLNRFGYAVPGYQTLLATDLVEGTTVNSWLWTQSTTTMTIAQTTGVLTLNNGAITTINTSAIITSNKQFAPINQAPIACSFKALVSQTTNAVNEIGFGAPTGVTAIVTNGAFFRINASGTIHTVTSFNGTENVSASLGNITTTSYYMFIVEFGDQGARFIMEDETGIPVVDTSVPYPLTTGQAIAVSHIPAFARVYVTGTAAGTAPQIKITSFQAYQFGINTTRPWSDQMGTSGKSALVNPTTFAQTLQLAAGAAPATITPNNTGSTLYATLGGEFSINITASSENLLGVFGFQSPSPYALVITDIQFQNPFITTALGATANYQEWCLMVANSNNPSTATGYRIPLGAYTAPSTAAAGTVYNGQPIIKNFTTPIIVLPGQYLLILVKQISASLQGTARGAIFINGYFE